MSENTKLQIAEHILRNCYWGNTNMTPSFIVEHINDKDFARTNSRKPRLFRLSVFCYNCIKLRLSVVFIEFSTVF